MIPFTLLFGVAAGKERIRGPVRLVLLLREGI
jgi:hypothetical protein